jgi:hypothetical protein
VTTDREIVEGFRLIYWEKKAWEQKGYGGKRREKNWKEVGSGKRYKTESMYRGERGM